MAYSAASSHSENSSGVSDPSIYTNYVNVHLSIDKLTGHNYATWSSDVRLWLKSQRYLDHLVPKAPTLTPTENDRWETIDVQLCVVLKGTFDPSLKQLFRSYETCAQIWEHAKLLYTNDTQHLYGVCSKFATLISSKHQDSMTDYMGKSHALFHEFNELLSPSPDPATEIERSNSSFSEHYTGLLIKIHIFVIKFWVPRLSPP